MAEVERDAHARALRQLASCPSPTSRRRARARHACASPSNPAAADHRARGGHPRALAPAAASRLLVRQQVESELQRILARRVRQLVDERLHDEREAVAARRAERSGRHAERHRRDVERVVRDEARREFGPPPGARRSTRFAERDEVIAPRDELAGRVDAAREVVEAGAAIRIVLHVVFARPQQLDRHAGHLLRDRRRFDHVVVGQAPAEAAARCASCES